MTETFAVGLFAIFSPAPITSTGGVPPLGVAAANKVPQTDPSPATPPAEFTQVDRIFASVLRVATGTIVPAGTFNPGAVPVVVFTYSDASVNALASAAAFVVPDPMLLYELINGASDQTAATVVTSVIETNVEGPRLPHGPSAAISAIAVLFVPGLSPGFGLPPFAVMYTSVDADQRADTGDLSESLTGRVGRGNLFDLRVHRNDLLFEILPLAPEKVDGCACVASGSSQRPLGSRTSPP
jgi:hypothetical protein